MPYEVQSNCPACGKGDKFSIGHWPRDIGVFPCAACKALVNLTLESRACPGCAQRPDAPELYDYARSIPYYNGEPVGALTPGPTCLKCNEGPVSFAITCHYNVGRLGRHEGPGEPPWIGEDYLEKSLFSLALVAFCSEFDLDPAELFTYYTLDPPTAPLSRVGLSLPIFMEIRNHVSSALLGDGLRLSNSEKLRHETLQRFPPEVRAALGVDQGGQPKKWWQFWR